MHTGPTSKKGEIARKRPYVVESVNQSGAKMIPLNKTKVDIENKLTGESVRFERVGGPMTICRHIQASEVKTTISEDEMPNRSRLNKQHTANNKGENMSKTKKNGKPGKMAFVVECLTGEKSMTKSEVVAAMMKKYPSTPLKTAKNTVSWTCSSKNSPARKQKLKFTYIDEVKDENKSIKAISKVKSKPAAKSKPATKAKVELPNRKKPAVESADKPAEAIAVSPETVTA